MSTPAAPRVTTIEPAPRDWREAMAFSCVSDSPQASSSRSFGLRIGRRARSESGNGCPGAGLMTMVASRADASSAAATTPAIGTSSEAKSTLACSGQLSG